MSGEPVVNARRASSQPRPVFEALEPRLLLDALQPDLLPSSDSGVADDDNLTNVTTPTIQIETTEAATAVAVYRSGVYVGDATLATGLKWEYTFAEGQLLEGTNSLTARTFDGSAWSGNSPTLSVTLDTMAPELAHLSVWGIGSIQDVQVVGTLAYAADASGALQIFDISTPSDPVLVGTCELTGRPKALHVVANRAYVVGSAYCGLQIVDVSDPAQPILLSYTQLSYYTYDVRVVGNMAYVAANNDFQVFDISDPSSPSLLGSYGLRGYAFDLDGSMAYVAAGTTGVVILDVSDPTAISQLGIYHHTPGNALDVVVSGDYAYVADLASFLVLNVSNPSAPTKVYQNTPSWTLYPYFEALALVDSTLYLADNGGIGFYGGLVIFDVSMPAAPVVLGKYATPGDTVAVAVDGTTAYVADDQGGLQILDVSTPAAVTPIGSYEALMAVDTEVIGNLAYVAAGRTSLKIFDVVDPDTPVLVGSYGIDAGYYGLYDVAVSGTTAYLGLEGKVVILDVSDPSDPLFLSEYALARSYDDARDVEIVDTTMYVGLGSDGIHVVDISDPSAPAFIRTLSVTAYDIEIAGSVAYFANGSGVRAMDITDPTAPVLKATFTGMGGVQDLAVSGTTVYTVNGYRSGSSYTNGLEVIDYSDPTAPVRLGVLTDVGSGVDIRVVGTNVYYATTRVYVVDVADPTAPTVTAFAEAVTINGIYVADGVVYAAAQRLKILEFGPPVLDLAASSDTGASNDDNVTGDMTPTFAVGGWPEYVRIYRDGTLVSGEYETSPVTVSAQPDGAYSYTARAVDAAGNVSELSNAVDVTIVCLTCDGNQDMKVDGADLAAWQANYDPLGLNAATNTYAMGDWDGDGYINGADLALWQANYNPLGLTILAEEPPVELAGGSAAGPDDLTFEPLGDFGTPVVSDEPAAAAQGETVKILPEVLVDETVTAISPVEAPAATAALVPVAADLPADDVSPAVFMPSSALAPAVFGAGVTRVSAAPDTVQARTARRAASVYRLAMRRDMQAVDTDALDLLAAAAPVV